MDIDPRILELATPRERELIDAMQAHGSGRAASAALGLNKDTVGEAWRRVERRAARAGIAPGHFQHGVAPGFLMGKVTVQRGPQGDVERVWERQSPGQSNALDILQSALAGVLDDFKGTLPATAAPKHYDADLLTVIPMAILISG